MDIWIRSQDKQELIKIDYIEANMGRIFIQYGTFRRCVGTYATQERALEILKEVIDKIKPVFLLEAMRYFKNEEILKEEDRLTKKHDKEFVSTTPDFKINPVNPNTVVYEMPEE